jgi:hypothetical protein
MMKAEKENSDFIFPLSSFSSGALPLKLLGGLQATCSQNGTAGTSKGEKSIG